MSYPEIIFLKCLIVWKHKLEKGTKLIENEHQILLHIIQKY